MSFYTIYIITSFRNNHINNIIIVPNEYRKVNVYRKKLNIIDTLYTSKNTNHF